MIDLEVIRSRVNAAMAGPWATRFENDLVVIGGPQQLFIADCDWDWGEQNWAQCRANATFIAHARADVPVSIDEMAQLQQRVAELERALQDMWNQFAYTDKQGERNTGGLSALENCADVLGPDVLGDG